MTVIIVGSILALEFESLGGRGVGDLGIGMRIVTCLKLLKPGVALSLSLSLSLALSLCVSPIASKHLVKAQYPSICVIDREGCMSFCRAILF